MNDIAAQAYFSIRLEDGSADYMGDGCWVLQRLEETPKGPRWNTFGITEEDRQVLLASEGALTIPLEDGEAHWMGDGCFVLVRCEPQGRHMVGHSIAVTERDLERLADALSDSWVTLGAA